MLQIAFSQLVNMQAPIFNSHPLVPAMHLVQLPIMNSAWIDFYNSHSGGVNVNSQRLTPKKKGFNIADILSEEKPSETVMRMASHPYYPAVQNPVQTRLPERTGKHIYHYTLLCRLVVQLFACVRWGCPTI